MTQAIVTIHGLTFGGEGVGRLPDGKAVFVPFTIPGETVEIEVSEDKKKFARANLVKVIESSSKRRPARCKHFGACGGCQLQHMSYDYQLEQKQQIVKDQLRRSGLSEGVVVNLVIGSPMEWNYRNAVQFHQTSEGRLGYQKVRSHEVIAIEECFLPLEPIDQAWKNLSLDPTILLDRISIRCGDEDDIVITLDSDMDSMPEIELDLPYSILHHSTAGNLVLAGSPLTQMVVTGQYFQVSVNSFFQINTAVAARIVDYVLGLLPEGEIDTLLDLYCGVGLFSKFVAPKVNNLIGIELSESACEDYAANLVDFNNVSLYQGAAEEVLPFLDIHPQVVIADPPRAGLADAALTALLKMRPEKLIYVSCDPSTLAQDLARLVDNGYALDLVQPFDLFPQTFHVECVVMLSDMKL